MTSTAPPSADFDEEDITPSSTGRDNPYPGADKKEWTDRFADALEAATGLPRSLIDAITAYVPQPKQYLQRQDGVYRLKPQTLQEDSGLTILSVRAHGFAGSPGEYNERIRGDFHSPLRPDARPDYVLPALTTGRTAGRPAAFLTTTDPVDLNRQARLLDLMDTSLNTADGDRGYRLVEDIEIYGQKEVTLHAPFVRQISEQTDTGSRIRAVPDLTAIKGANRSRARLALFGLSVRDIVFGLRPYAHMGISRADDPRSADPTYWIPIFATILKDAFDDPDHPGHTIAMRAQNVATVPIQIIVGATNLEGFHNSVFDPNRVDHRRPPLDYKLSEKAASDLRAILREAVNYGELEEPERAWLAGEAPDPVPEAGEDRIAARDRRDRTLYDIVFPSSPERRRLIRRVLGEPAPSQTGRRHVDNRMRMISAVVSDGYSHRWNPRVLDGLLRPSSIKDGTTFAPDATWADLLASAGRGDEKALETFIITRGMHWLAEHKIVEADRGSVGAQTHEVDDEAETRRIRRTMNSVRDALKVQPTRTIGLMRELAHAANTRSEPRQVDVEGRPLDGTRASRAWFDEAFPKKPARRRAPRPGPSDDPGQPEPTPQQKLLVARDTFEAAVTHGLVKAFADVFSTAKELDDAATDANAVALPDNLTDTVTKVLGDALAAARKDLRGVGTVLQVLQHGGGDPADFVSECAVFFDAEAGR
ncbi:hypothetical protein [Streptomyces sp. NPDC051286]|uniref:hypothetical protein n=1 Tax=Streptomyces sp. NPDC051286 TaxID=3365647 RepID=UPI00379FAEC6